MADEMANISLGCSVDIKRTDGKLNYFYSMIVDIFHNLEAERGIIQVKVDTYHQNILAFVVDRCCKGSFA